MVDASKGFVRFDLVITKSMHLANIANGVYPVLDVDLDPKLKIKKESVPNFSDLKEILERVGKPYGWDRRAEYHNPESIEEISEKLAGPNSSRYSFWSGKKEVGGAIIANVEPNLASIFQKAHDGSTGVQAIDIDPGLADKAVEIYKIGLFPEYTKRGWGKFFLPQLLEQLFNHKSQPEVVYLNTRNTNHSGVVNFYTGLNMNVIHARSHPNDLIDPPAGPRRPPSDYQPVAQAS